VQSPQQLPGLLTEGGLGVPPLYQEEVVEASPVVWDIQILVEVHDVPPAPREGHGQDQEAKVLEIVPMKSRSQAAKKLVKGGRNTYDPEHGGNSPQPRVNGRYIHSLVVGRELLPLPQFVKH
jgi:hypothetical protein